MSTNTMTSIYREADAIFSATETIRRQIEADSAEQGATVDTINIETQQKYARIMLRELSDPASPATPLTKRVIQELVKFIHSPRNRIYVVDISLNEDTYGPNHYLIIAFAKISKAPNSEFETAIYERIFPRFGKDAQDSLNGLIRTTIACPIILKRFSEGLNSPTMLGWFPEHCGARKQEQQYHPAAKAFYIISRFAKRFKSITLKAIQRCTTKSSFQNLKNFLLNANEEELARFFLEAPSVWLMIHEAFHSQSPLPLHDYLKVFQYIELGGLEELRVDMFAMVMVRQQKTYDLANVVSEYILATRLLAYALIDFLTRDGKDPIPSFDTFGSHYLFLWLLEKGKIAIVQEGPDKGKLHVDCDDCFESIAELSKKVTQLYRDAKIQHEEAPINAKNDISSQALITQDLIAETLRQEMDRVVLGQKRLPTIDFEFELKNRKQKVIRLVKFRMLRWFADAFEAISPIDDWPSG